MKQIAVVQKKKKKKLRFEKHTKSSEGLKKSLQLDTLWQLMNHKVKREKKK